MSYSSIVTTISITFSSYKIQNGDIPVLVNPGSPGKWPLKLRERERERERENYVRILETGSHYVESRGKSTHYQ